MKTISKYEEDWNKKAKKLFKKTKKLIRKHFGKKCKDFEGLCDCCRRYEALEELKVLFESPYED